MKDIKLETTVDVLRNNKGEITNVDLKIFEASKLKLKECILNKKGEQNYGNLFDSILDLISEKNFNPFELDDFKTNPENGDIPKPIVEFINEIVSQINNDIVNICQFWNDNKIKEENSEIDITNDEEVLLKNN